MSKTAKKVIAIVFVILFGGWLVISVVPFNKDKTTVIENNPKREIYEPQFEHEANLSFYNSADSLIKTIKLELADNDQEITYGMMYRKSIDDDMGMLFLMEKEEQRSFWMKNTYVPLDIIYINAKNEIVSFRKNAKPLTETPQPSVVPSSKVLEVKGGFSDKYGLIEGDKISFERL